MDETTQIGFFKQLEIACFKPGQYKRLLEVSKGKVIAFVLVVTFLIAFLGFGVNIIGFGVSVGGPRNLIMNRLPKFEIDKGQFHIKNPVDFVMGGVHIVANDKNKAVKKSALDQEDQYASELIFAREEAVIRNPVLTSKVTRIDYKDYASTKLTNASLARLLPVFYAILGATYLLVWGSNIIFYLMFCGLIAAFVHWSMKMRHVDTHFGQIFQLAIYARVIFAVVEAMGNSIGLFVGIGSLWSFLCYIGSYELLAYAVARIMIPPKE